MNCIGFIGETLRKKSVRKLFEELLHGDSSDLLFSLSLGLYITIMFIYQFIKALYVHGVRVWILYFLFQQIPPALIESQDELISKGWDSYGGLLLYCIICMSMLRVGSENDGRLSGIENYKHDHIMEEWSGISRNHPSFQARHGVSDHDDDSIV